MKKLLLAIACFAYVSVTAQVTPEFIYTNGYVSPLNLDGTVAKYLFVDEAGDAVRLFNPNHGLWKTVAIPLAATGTATTAMHVSTSVFNTDALVEVLYRRTGDTAKLVNEVGAVLFSADSAKRASVDVLPGFPPAIMVDEPLDALTNPFHSVYRSATFTRIGPRVGQSAYRVNLPSSGEKIVSCASTGGGSLNIYSLDGSLFASFWGGADGARFLGENIINADTKLEASAHYAGTSNVKIVNSDGTTLLSNNGSSGAIAYSHLDGQPDKSSFKTIQKIVFTAHPASSLSTRIHLVEAF